MRRIGWIGAGVALAGVLLWAGLRPREPGTAGVPARTVATPGAPDAIAARQPTASQAIAPAPAPPSASSSAPPRAAEPFVLPTPHSALKDIVQDLQREAARGNAQAACRLGAELLRCVAARTGAQQRLSSETMARVLANRRMDDAEIDRDATRMLEAQRTVDAEVARCEGVDLQMLASPARWFMQAADAGHVRSMAEALSPRMYDSRALFRDPGLIPAYQARAERYFRMALEAGEPAILSAWYSASRYPESDPLAAVLPAAWRGRAFVDALQARISRARTAHAAPAGLVARPARGAEQEEADRVFSRYFEGRLAPLHPVTPVMQAVPPLEHFDCASATR